MEATRWKFITLIAVGFVLVTSLSALATSSAGKSFFKNFGRASVIPPPVEKKSDTHIVISVVAISGTDSMSLYNPSWDQVDVSGWELKKKTANGKEYSIIVFPPGSVIPGKGNFIWASSGNSQVDANITSTATLAVDNSAALLDKDGNQIDAVAWGKGMNQYIEGSALPNPKTGRLIMRKFNGDIPIDTENNLSDFEIK